VWGGSRALICGGVGVIFRNLHTNTFVDIYAGLTATDQQTFGRDDDRDGTRCSADQWQ